MLLSSACTIFATAKRDRGSSSAGRALASQAEGRGFEPRLPLVTFLLTDKIFDVAVRFFVKRGALFCEKHRYFFCVLRNFVYLYTTINNGNNINK